MTWKAPTASQGTSAGVALDGQTGRVEEMTELPGRTARKDAPVTPIIRVMCPLAEGRSALPAARISPHLFPGVPFRRTSTLVPSVTQ